MPPKQNPPNITWKIIFLFTLITAVVMLTRSLDLSSYDDYFYGNSKAIISTLLFLVFSLGLYIAVSNDNKKLLFYTGSLEFAILLLPFLSFSTSPDYLPYILTPVMAFSFLPLWILLPVGLMSLLTSEFEMKRMFYTLFAITLLLPMFWAACGLFAVPLCTTELNYDEVSSFQYSITSCEGYGGVDTFSFSVAALFLIFQGFIWFSAYHKAQKKPVHTPLGCITSKLPSYMKDNSAPFILLFLVLAIIAFGYVIMGPPHVCGDGICEGDEDYTCHYDCSFCGDGFCEFTETAHNCPGDCGYCGDGHCDDVEEYDGTCVDDCNATSPTVIY